MGSTVHSFAIRPVLMNGKPAGKEYSYLPYGLNVKTEVTATDGSHLIVIVRELYDIQVAEPDPAHWLEKVK